MLVFKHSFFIFCFQGDGLCCNFFLKCPWATVLLGHWLFIPFTFSPVLPDCFQRNVFVFKAPSTDLRTIQLKEFYFLSVMEIMRVLEFLSFLYHFVPVPKWLLIYRCRTVKHFLSNTVLIPACFKSKAAQFSTMIANSSCTFFHLVFILITTSFLAICRARLILGAKPSDFWLQIHAWIRELYQREAPVSPLCVYG